jgi:tubulin-specific chaperone B
MATLPHTQTPADISLQVTSPLIRTEKRITPSWTVGHLKGRLETVTGIPPGCMRLVLHAPGKGEIEMQGDEQQVGQWITGLGPGMGEITVCCNSS